MIIIPARLQSTRFPRKMLADVLGYPMIVRSALVAKEVDDVIVATDSQEIIEVCQRYKIDATMTEARHTSGTDRCAEAARKLGLSSDEIIINMQGDEPFLESQILSALKKMMVDSDAFMGTCIQQISEKEAQDPNLVKVVLDTQHCAMYFSRFAIPFHRDMFSTQSVGITNLGASQVVSQKVENVDSQNQSLDFCKESDGDIKAGKQNQTQHNYFGHLGIYAFRSKNLQEFCTLPKSPLEEIEKLEQLRALWNQKKIQTVLVQTQSIGIDTQEDLQRVTRKFAK